MPRLMNSSDILKVNNAEELVGLIDEVLQYIPEMGFFNASPVIKNVYQTLAVTGHPTVGFRVPGTDRIFDTATLENKEVKCKYLDATWVLEKAVATQSDWGKEMACSLQAKTHLQAAFFALSKQIWYGASNDANGGFQGLHTYIDAVTDSNNNKEKVINANPNTVITDGSTVFAVRTGLDSVQLAWGSEGKFAEGDIEEELIAGTNSDGNLAGRMFYRQELAGWVGMQVTSRHAAAKIENLSAVTSNNGLNDQLLYDLLQTFPVGYGPDAFFMSRRSLAQLRSSRTATNATGAPAPIPQEFESIPIIVTDAILDSETNVVDTDGGSGSGSGSGS